MASFIESLAAPGEFLPHGLCLTWRPELVYTHLLSDVATGLAYFSIPVGLLYFVSKRRDLEYKWMFLMFAAFILACGTTHFYGAYTLWIPDYTTQAGIKAVTAVVSVATAILLYPLIPKALALPSPAQLRAANAELAAQVAERRRAEEEVRRANLELAGANERLRASEAYLAGLFGHLSDAVFVVAVEEDGRFRFEALNPAHERATGLRTEAVAGRTPEDLFPPELASHLRGRYAACVAARRAIDYEETLDLPGGRRTWQTVLAPMADERGRVFRLIGTARDVTEHRRLQEELAQAQKLATLGTMAAGVAHEMGQPLNAIRISAEDCRMMMAEGQTDPAYLAESLDLVADQARRMGEILDQMRSLSRREASDEAEPFDPVVPVRRAIALVERHFGSEDVAIEQALEDPAGRVTGRAGQLEQVMINLLGNARDAIDSRRRRDGDQSPGRIKVRLDRVPGKPQVLIEVDDDGTGISPELAERMFDPFFTTKDASKGTGLGLSICSSLIAAMGGSIAARPLPRGTRLSIRLPLGPMPVEGDLAATAEEAGHG